MRGSIGEGSDFRLSHPGFRLSHAPPQHWRPTATDSATRRLYLTRSRPSRSCPSPAGGHVSQFAHVLAKRGYVGMSLKSGILRLQKYLLGLAPLPECSFRGLLFVSVPSLQLALAIEQVLET